MTRVTAVIVTYNRLTLLKRAVQSIFNQSSKPENLIIINNASTDGTDNYLLGLERGNIDIKVHPITLKSNTGGAGGFNKGLEKALEFAPDYIWMMDDDGAPAPDCLNNLLKSANPSSIFNPLVVDESDHARLAFRLGNTHTVAEARRMAIGPLIEGHANPFNGTLIPAAIAKKIGLPKKEMFIWGDEEEYVMRASKVGVKIYTNIEATHFHPKEKGIRTPVLLNIMGSVVLKPNGMLRIYLRNQFYICRKYGLTMRMTRTILKYLTYAITRFDLKVMRDIYVALKESKSI